MKIILPILFIFLLSLSVIGKCKKHKDSSITGGGKGGNAKITILPEHMGSLVDSGMVCIKYGTLDAPADNVYDDSARCIRVNDSVGVAKFDSLQTGLYYFYMHGYHTALHLNVMGGKSITISRQNEIDSPFYLPVGQ